MGGVQLLGHKSRQRRGEANAKSCCRRAANVTEFNYKSRVGVVNCHNYCCCCWEATRDGTMMMAFNRVSNLLKLIVSWECVTAKGATDGEEEE